LRQIITALDIGSSKIKVLIAEIDDKNNIEILGMSVVDAKGLNNGIIQDVAAVSDKIVLAISEAEDHL